MVNKEMDLEGIPTQTTTNRVALGAMASGEITPQTDLDQFVITARGQGTLRKCATSFMVIHKTSSSIKENEWLPMCLEIMVIRIVVYEMGKSYRLKKRDE